MKVAIASDHRGFELKGKVIDYLKGKGYDVTDYGTDNSEYADYPIYAFKLGESVRDKVEDLGILICGTGIGMSIACNKVKGIRCGKVSSVEEAILTKGHNHANVIAISESIENPFEVIEAFLTSKFLTEERYVRRVQMVDDYDN